MRRKPNPVRKIEEEDVRVAAERYHNARQAAAALGVTSTSLRRRMTELGVVPRWARKED